MKESYLKIYKYIEESLDIEFEACGIKHLDGNYESKFRSSFYSLFSVVKKGRIESILRLKDKTLKIKRNELIACYIPRETPAKTMLSGVSEADILWSRMNFNIFGSLDLLDFFEIPYVFAPAAGAEILSLNQRLHMLEAEKDNDPLRSLIKRKKLCFQMLDLILTCAVPKTDCGRKFAAIEELLPVVNYINKNCRQKISNRDLAKLTHLSLSRFCHKFKTVFGLSPRKYIQQLRFLEISRLLADTNTRINEIASEYGFSDQFHFSRAFKSASGYSPREYRNLVKAAKGKLFSS
ncbi:MAG: AraC family transcriptional regulator [Victivallaceae bacterium]|nr:AraC family transcriptional regulator [Victivallaceae bacterium]